MARKTLHLFQREAVDKAVAELKKAGRAKVIMPCGTGKSLVGLSVLKRLSQKRSLIVAPSLALVKQLLDTYAAELDLPRVLVVCSDDTTAKDAREKYDIPNVTTDPQEIARQVAKDAAIIIFGTYQSTPRIADAFALGGVPSLNFGLFDEAHRMAGGSKMFTTALCNKQIPIACRLFMTATPRIATQSAKSQAADEGYTFASMDDETQFGKEAFYMSFNEAIEGGHLTDYRVAVFVVKESEIQSLVDQDEDAKDLAKRIAIVRAMAQHDIRKVLAYHRTVRQMNWFADIGIRKTFAAFKEAGAIDGTLWSGALEGADNASVRRSTLNHFASINGDSRAVLNNCQVLQEGVDCPSVDAVCLVDPRSQPVDIVQIVGRAIRNSPDKKVATVILPVFMPDSVGDDVEAFVASSEFSPVWDVVAALRSHDNRVQGWVSSSQAFGEWDAKSHIEFNFDMPANFQKKFFDAIESRIVRRFHEPMMLTNDIVWEWMQKYRTEHGSWPTKTTTETAPDGSSWAAIDQSLANGSRGCERGYTLSKLWKINSKYAVLTEELIWSWMQSYYSAKGRWPTVKTKEISPCSISWSRINECLREGLMGCKGGSSLKSLWRMNTGRHYPVGLTEDLIWSWMKDYYQLHGAWPLRCAELAPDGSKWETINACLRFGLRGCSGGMSLSKLIKSKTGHLEVVMTESMIWTWMKGYYVNFGKWPTKASVGKTPSGLSWIVVNQCMREGRRGCKKGGSLSKLRTTMLNRDRDKSLQECA